MKTNPNPLITAAKNAALAGLVVVCGLVATREWKSVEAYVTTGTHYATPTASYYINPGFPDPSAGNAAAQIAAIRAGADTWHNQAQVPFSFVYAGTTAVNTVAFDGVNSIFYSPTDGGGALAVCYWWTSGGATQQFDIEFFDRAGTYDFIWATNPTASQFDIQSVAAHEFGHALGLNHSTVATATMYPSVAPGDLGNRTLDADDVSGAQSLYGVATPTVTSCSPSHGFALGGNSVTVFGSNFTPGATTVSFAGHAASSVTYVSATQISCTVPAAVQNGAVSVAVTCNGASASAPVYSYDMLRIDSTPIHGGVSILEVMAPADAGRAYQIVASLGNTGIPLSLYLNPADTRILPGVFDDLFVYSVQTPNNYFGNFHSVLDQTGHASAQFFVPSSLQAVGKTVTFSVVTFNTQALSGLQQIGNGVTVTIQ